MTVDIIFVILGLAMLVVGGEVMIRGATGLAKGLGVSPLAIGLTVVAFGTSAPELALNIIAALNDNTDLSFGNIVGSNIANIGLILGIAALVRPLAVNAGVIKRELPMMVAATLIAVSLGVFPSWESANTFGPIDGILLLSGFLAFVGYTLVRAKASHDDFEEHVVRIGTSKGKLAFSLVMVLIGLVLLGFGGSFAERGATGIARSLGMSDELIGLTVVAMATSLPELVTSIVAVRRGQVDIAVGNIVGSNLFNLLLVLGVTSLITPVPLPETGIVSLIVMSGFALVLIPMSRTHGQRLSRFEGATLLICYLSYIGYEIWGVISHV